MAIRYFPRIAEENKADALIFYQRYHRTSEDIAALHYIDIDNYHGGDPSK